MSDRSNDDRAHGIGEREPSGLPIGALAREVEAGISTQLRRVTGVLGTLLRHVGLRLERRESIGHKDRKRVVAGLFHEGERARPFVVRFLALMGLSVTIASLGIIADSTAVVIGAMLVAPLMGPVVAIAAAVVMAWPQRVLRSSLLVAASAAGSVALGYAISLLIPGDSYPLPGELVARTSPNLLDMGIALAAGAAGAYGQMRRLASDALPGVAVAVALVPPLAVAGIALQLWEWQMALGAFMLFVVNVVGIVLSASFTFIAAGFVPGRRLLTGNSTIASGVRWSAVAVLIVVFPLQFGRGRVLPPSDHTAVVTAAVEDFVDLNQGYAEVVDVSIDILDGVTDVDVVVASPVGGPQVSALAQHVAETVGGPVTLKLQVVTAQTSGAVVLDP